MYIRLRISKEQADAVLAYWKNEHSIWYEEKNKTKQIREVKFGFHNLGSAYTWLTCGANQGMLYQDKIGWLISYWGRRHAVGGFALPTLVLEEFAPLSSLEIDEYQSSRLDINWWDVCSEKKSIYANERDRHRNASADLQNGS